MTTLKHLMNHLPVTLPLSLAICALFAGPLASHAQTAKPKTSKHASFKPENFERLAVIVKPIKQQNSRTRGFGYQQEPELGQVERLIEQSFLRTLIGGGYTLVSRGDLDAAMKEKGLDQANMTDEKRAQEAGKLLHVSTLMIVTVDSFKTTLVQLPANPATTSAPQYVQGSNRRVPGFGGGDYSQNGVRQVFQVLASVSARLVKIDDNMVMWTGDHTVSQNLATEEQGSIVLASVAEAIAMSFPPLTPPASSPKKATMP
jgi:hypothetical protein